MTKEQIGKEIKELIRSIKTHYTFVEEEDRIPLIELELITSKIRKLYEKSIINNYLHSNDEAYMLQERSRRFKERGNFERNEPVTFVKKQIVQAPAAVEPIIEPPAAPIEKVIPTTVAIEEGKEIKKEEVPVSAPVQHSHSGKHLKDLKLLIGINDKFLLINNLFARNDTNYKDAIEHLSNLHTVAEAKSFLDSLARQYSWNVESYAFVRLVQIVEKRYK